uniref:Alpha-2-macroglobulin receptor-associated protein n=1 Tax=Caligus rogercresseyi TaxID=217165 RepID=C1BPA1_CALRO|nr:Alpha-2-macroglobulin receptor-associated protein precursor [Caligus rogercresseyi]
MRALVLLPLSVLLLFLLLLVFFPSVESSYSELESPFRLNKCNLLWDKVVRSHHFLQESKLKAFFNVLRVHEKEELALKRHKAEGKDKTGSFEEQVRKKFAGILEEFSLRHLSSEESDGPSSRKGEPFGDKKLLKLWEKARQLGLEDEELHDFKVELLQYQEEVEEYRQLLEQAHSESHRNANSIHDEDKAQEEQLSSHLGDKRRALKNHLGTLQMRLINSVPSLEDDEFSHPEVQDLWRFAQDGNFSEDELEDLIKTELRVYEKKLNKVKHLEEELRLVDERQGGELNEVLDQSEGRKILNNKLKKHAHAIDELRKQMKHLILTRHTEL